MSMRAQGAGGGAGGCVPTESTAGQREALSGRNLKKKAEDFVLAQAEPFGSNGQWVFSPLKEGTMKKLTKPEKVLKLKKSTVKNLTVKTGVRAGTATGACNKCNITRSFIHC
jgi:hypothetical protein